MSHAQAVLQQAFVKPADAASSRVSSPAVSSRVVALRARRATLPVVIDGPFAIERVAALLHSPLGVYVSATAVEHGTFRVTLDIAPEDFDFTLHTLLATLPEATIGALTCRQPNGVKRSGTPTNVARATN